jgi:predicted nucleic acid-binding protein
MGMIDIESFTGDRVYLDANVFIYAVEGFERYAALCTAILQSIEDMKIHAVTSELSLAEVLVRPLKLQNAGVVESYKNLIQSQFDLKVVPVSREILVTAATIRATSGCRMPDAIHIATAQDMKSEFFFTADKAIKVSAPLRVVTLDELLEG